MSDLLPTCVSGAWTVTSMRDSFLQQMKSDQRGNLLRLFFYAITTSGWNEFRKTIKVWKKQNSTKEVVVFVGTDHGITDPVALEEIQKDGFAVRLMQTHRGVFHPKVIWLTGGGKNTIWVGSNNLTRDGLMNNIEFAVRVESAKIPITLTKWLNTLEKASVLLTQELLNSYAKERQLFETRRAKAKVSTFTWSKKSEPPSEPAEKANPGDLIMEIMPLETGPGGKQVQLPKEAARDFFGISDQAGSKAVKLKPLENEEVRPLTMTIFGNETVRLSINELEYGDRPCVIVFKKHTGIFEFEIVSKSIFPTRFKNLIKQCVHQTRVGSRHWGYAQ